MKTNYDRGILTVDFPSGSTARYEATEEEAKAIVEALEAEYEEARREIEADRAMDARMARFYEEGF